MRNKALIILFLLTCPLVDSQDMAPDESVKAEFIFNFIDFVEWNDDLRDYNICMPDNEHFRAFVKEAVRQKIVHGRRLVVVNSADICHVLISDTVPQRDADKILTIGPLDKGALIEFRVVDNEIKFAVNPETVKKSKLKISSQLLKLAILEDGS